MPLPLLPVIAGGGVLVKVASVAYIVGLVSKVIAALGLSAYAFTGIDYGLDALQVEINNNLTGMPFDVKSLLDLAGITTILTWIINAHAFKVLIKLSKFALFRTKAFSV